MPNHFEQITIHDVVEALEPLANIERPDGDNEGDPINGTSVYRSLSSSDKAKVDHAEEVVVAYSRQCGRRGVTEMNKRGYHASFDQDVNDETSLVGYVKVGEWKLVIR